MHYQKSECEYLRIQAKQKFDQVRSTWIDAGLWALPHRTKVLLQQVEGERNNRHIVDTTHILALRSYVAGFLEGNTSATRPWYRTSSDDPEKNLRPENHVWLDKFTRQTLKCLSSSNFYHATGQFYYDFGVFNTGSLYIDEIREGLFFHNLVPGSYYVINNSLGEAVVLVREFALTVKALVDRYGVKKKGKWDWSNFSKNVRKMYEDSNYTQMIDIVHVVKENEHYNPEQPQGGTNRKWVSISYELGGSGIDYASAASGNSSGGVDPMDESEKDKFLKISYSKRKPFIVGASDRSGTFEWGEKGPTTDALGCIKSLNKKAISKDQALEQMLRPALQGPANLRKSYITHAPNSFIPLDAAAMAQKGMRPVFEMNPGIGTLIQDVSDLRQQVDRLYYSDYLLYLSRNPKTRTATETEAIVNEQQLIIGPNLQSLNYTYNMPLVEFVMDFVLDTDPHLEPPPEDLAGNFLRTEFISVFAQAQKAADLPAIERYIAMVMNVGQISPKMFDKANFDKLADLYEDRLFLPAGLNNPQGQVDALREQAMKQAQRQQMLQETLPAVAGAAKDIGLTIPQQKK